MTNPDDALTRNVALAVLAAILVAPALDKTRTPTGDAEQARAVTDRLLRGAVLTADRLMQFAEEYDREKEGWWT